MAATHEMPIPKKLWEHPNPDSTNMAEFMRIVNGKRGLGLKVRVHACDIVKLNVICS